MEWGVVLELEWDGDGGAGRVMVSVVQAAFRL